MTKGRQPRAPVRQEEDSDDGRVALLGLQKAIGNQAVQALLRNGGTALPLAARAPMEASFGRSFADVRLHTGAAVDAAAARLDANAFTVGADIYVRSDAPGADTRAGRALLGEELAHVVQGVGTQSVERVTSPYEPLERDARRAGSLAATGHSARVRSTSQGEVVVARQEPTEENADSLTTAQWLLVQKAMVTLTSAIAKLGQVPPDLAGAQAVFTASGGPLTALLNQEVPLDAYFAFLNALDSFNIGWGALEGAQLGPAKTAIDWFGHAYTTLESSRVSRAPEVP